MDSALRVGSVVTGSFDPLVAKVVVHVFNETPEGLPRVVSKLQSSLTELHLEGVSTNVPALQALLRRPELGLAWSVTTELADEVFARLAPEDDGSVSALCSPLRAEVVEVRVAPGDRVRAGDELVILEALKMHHAVVAAASATVTSVRVDPGQVVPAGFRLLDMEQGGNETSERAASTPADLDALSPSLAALRSRLATTLDEGRPEAVAKRHARGGRTARENVASVCDEGSFREIGQLALAAQRRIRSQEELIKKSPADGIVAGIATVNAELFGAAQSQCAVLAYDYTVMAGTQGYMGHKKTDRVLQLARRGDMPAIAYCEGGGGRPNEVDFQDVSASALDGDTFAIWAGLSRPRIAVANGPCFAGNAVLFGCADVTIATERSFVGMAGPAMVEAGGLGACRVEDIGPVEIQRRNGVVDLVVDDEVEAASVSRQVLAYFQGATKDWNCGDQRALRRAIPEDRKRVYDLRNLLECLFDTGSYLELRRDSGPGMVVGLARIEGQPLGFFANDPRHLGGAIDAEGTDQAAWIMALCERFRLPLLSLCDTPGFMVGPEHERHATVRRAGHMMNTAAQLTVPLVTICLRKGYGLGAQAMAGGSFWQPTRMLSWPSGEFGPMGLEGAVRLGFRRQLEAETDPDARRALFEREVQKLYDLGKALSAAAVIELDAVIDPADSRSHILAALRSG